MTLRAYGSFCAALLVGVISAGWTYHSYRLAMVHLRSSLEWEGRYLASRSGLEVSQAESEQNDLASLNHLEKLTKSPNVQFWMIVDGHQKIRWHSDPRQEGRAAEGSYSFPQGIRWIPASPHPALESWVTVVDQRGQKSVMVVRLSSQLMNASARSRLIFGGWASLILSALSGWIFWLSWRSIAHSLATLQDAVRTIGEGLSPSWAPQEYPELRSIQSSLQLVLGHLHDHQAHAQAAHQELTATLSRLLAGWTQLFPQLGIIAFNDQNRIISATPLAQTLLRVPLASGTHVLEAFTAPEFKALVQTASQRKNVEASASAGGVSARALCSSQDNGRTALLLIIVEKER